MPVTRSSSRHTAEAEYDKELFGTSDTSSTSNTRASSQKGISRGSVKGRGKGVKSASASTDYLVFGLLVAGWAIFSTISDTLIKNALIEWNFPLSVTLVQFVIVAFYCTLVIRVFGILPYQKGEDLVTSAEILPPAFAHTMGFYATIYCYGKVAMSLAQTVKASDPLFVILISMFFRNESFSIRIYLSMIPIIGGVLLTSASDVSFELTGFLACVAANTAFVFRSIMSKEVMSKMDCYNAFSYLYNKCILFLIPMFLVLEFPSMVSMYYKGDYSFIPSQALLTNFFLSGTAHFLYNMISFMVLSRVVPLTHAVINNSRRLFVIIASVLYFGNTPTLTTVVGIVSVFAGIGLYMNERMKEERAKKEKPAQ